MTTPEAAMIYEREFISAMKDKQYAVYNPHSKPLGELPTVYGFNNGGGGYFFEGVLLAEDGTKLGSHLCSAEGYMRHDLGILEGTRADRHEIFKAHYPNGYKMDFVSYKECGSHAGLQGAIKLAKSKNNNL